MRNVDCNAPHSKLLGVKPYIVSKYISFGEKQKISETIFVFAFYYIIS